MGEIELVEPLSELTTQAKADIHWTLLSDGRIVTTNVVARALVQLEASPLDDSIANASSHGTLVWGKPQP